MPLPDRCLLTHLEVLDVGKVGLDAVHDGAGALREGVKLQPVLLEEGHGVHPRLPRLLRLGLLLGRAGGWLINNGFSAMTPVLSVHVQAIKQTATPHLGPALELGAVRAGGPRDGGHPALGRRLVGGLEAIIVLLN